MGGRGRRRGVRRGRLPADGVAADGRGGLLAGTGRGAGVLSLPRRVHGRRLAGRAEQPQPARDVRRFGAAPGRVVARGTGDSGAATRRGCRRAPPELGSDGDGWAAEEVPDEFSCIDLSAHGVRASVAGAGSGIRNSDVIRRQTRQQAGSGHRARTNDPRRRRISTTSESRAGGAHRVRTTSSAATASRQSAAGSRGQGQDRTADLPLFRRSLVPTELPGRAGDRRSGRPERGESTGPPVPTISAGTAAKCSSAPRSSDTQ